MRTLKIRFLHLVCPRRIRTLCALTLCLSLSIFIENIHAATYFISPIGSDSNAGTSSDVPWKTFDYAFAQIGCGDTLLLQNGHYTRPVNTRPYILSLTCSSIAPLIIKAEHERQAWISDDGCVSTFIINKSAYITLDGLRLSSTANAACTAPNTILAAIDSHHLVLKNLLYHTANFNANFPLQQFTRVTDSLVEDVEGYGFHRHAFGNDDANHNVFRRVYCNDRGSPAGDTGDGCVTWYPGSDNIAENIISEGDAYVTDIQALGISQNNKVLGSIGIGGPIGAFGSYRCRSNDAGGFVPTNMPVNNMLQDIVYIGHVSSTGFGLTFRGNRNTQVKHASFFNPSTNNWGISADVEGASPCAPPYSVFIENSFVRSANTTATPYGFILSGQTSWSLMNTDAYGNSIANYSPAPPSSSHVNVRTQDPQMGPCKLWVPDGSPMKGAASDGGDIGATVLYRYQGGVLTNVPLWDPVTGKFPCRSTVAGVNDVPGSSCFDVHQRLSVNTNGCYFPARYAQGRDTTPPNPPQNVVVR